MVEAGWGVKRGEEARGASPSPAQPVSWPSRDEQSPSPSLHVAMLQ